jgi:4-hydroxybenzoate polyprenyltransferase
MTDVIDERKLPFILRFFKYCKERFPLHQNGLLITVFTFSATSFSRICRGHTDFIPLSYFIPGAVTAILFFFLLRIADEFKDADEDRRFRPYRAVPRGLVSLRELTVVAWVIILIIVIINSIIMPQMLIAVLVVLLYLGLMTKEFFIPVWLKKHPFLYMLTHMFIMPVIDFYATGLDWLNEHQIPSEGLYLFLIISFSNGIVLEMGRKIRARDAEEVGVETYSALIGEKRATVTWISVILLTFAIAVAASILSGSASFGVPLLVIFLSAALFFAVRFLLRRVQSNARMLEVASGIWTLGMYLILGATPAIILFIKSRCIGIVSP